MTLNDLIKNLSSCKETYGEYKVVSFSTEYKDVKDEEFRLLLNDGKNVLYIGLKKDRKKKKR